MKSIKSFFICLGLKPKVKPKGTPEDVKNFLKGLFYSALLYAYIFIAVSLIAGCATVEYVPVPLDLPDRPILPTVKSTELQCLSGDVYTRLVQRDRLQHGHIEVLEAVIVSTQP